MLENTSIRSNYFVGEFLAKVLSVEKEVKKTSKRNKKILSKTLFSNKKLEDNEIHNFAFNHVLIHYDSKTVFTYIPKNGCTSLRYSLAVANGYIQDSEINFDWIHDNNETMNPTHAELLNAHYSIIIIRCPFSRILSCFIDKVVNKDGSAYSEIKKYCNDWDDSKSFRDFINLFKNAILPLESNHHWRPQVDFLIFKDYDLFIPLEDLSQQKYLIEEKINNKFIDTRYIANHHHKKYKTSKSVGSDMSISEIIRNRNKSIFPDLSSFYDKNILFDVSNLYSADIRLYIEKFGENYLIQNLKILKKFLS